MKNLKIFLINLFILYFFLYVIELIINYKKENLFKKTRLYYLNKEEKKNLDKKLYLNFAGYKLIDKKEQLILPLSGYENAKILLCLDENNEPIYFESDEFGFNNKHQKNLKNILLIGDSYVQGMCVNSNNNLNGQLKKLNLNSINLGVAGNGPLLEYATFKEYGPYYKYNQVILLITPDNDFYDLSNEIENTILSKYLKNEKFNQNLPNESKKRIKQKILNNYFGKKTERFAYDFFTIYHFNLKEISKSIKNMFNSKSKKKNYYYLKNSEIDNIFFMIIDKFYSETKINNIKFYIVFNSFSPDILFPNNNERIKYRKLIDTKVNKIKNYLKRKEITYFDFTEYLEKNYNNKNINKIFKNINNRWDHYTEKGYEILAKEIIELIN